MRIQAPPNLVSADECLALIAAGIDDWGGVSPVTVDHVNPEAPWPAIKLAYASLLTNHQQPELAETFYNSVACRLLDRTYYHNDYIFWRPQASTELIESVQPTYRCYYPATYGLRTVLRQIVADLGPAQLRSRPHGAQPAPQPRPTPPRLRPR